MPTSLPHHNPQKQLLFLEGGGGAQHCFVIVTCSKTEKSRPPHVRSHMAATGAAADGLFRCVYEGCISGSDVGVERRPYHRNCGCALHNKSRNKQCTHGGPKCKKVSYPLRRAWSEGSLALVAASSAHSSPSSSPAQHHHAVAVGRQQQHPQLGTLCDDDQEEEEDENIIFFKV